MSIIVKVMLFLFVLLFYVVAIFAYITLTNNPSSKPSMSYGYDEQKDVWNRIRVDEKGHVICSKE